MVTVVKVSVGLVESVLVATVLVESMLDESLRCTGVLVESMVESVLVAWCAFSLVRGSGTGGVLDLPRLRLVVEAVLFESVLVESMLVFRKLPVGTPLTVVVVLRPWWAVAGAHFGTSFVTWVASRYLRNTLKE